MLNQGERIRLASEKDAAELLSIYTPYIEKTAITFEIEVPTVEEFAGRIRNTLEKYPYLVAEENGRIVGYAYASPFKSRAAYDWSVETSIYVRMGEQSRGIGSALYAVLEEILAEQNITNVNACIAQPEVPDEYLTNQSVEFHTRKGYSMVGRFHNCANKFNRWYHMVWMEKMIGEHKENPESFIPFSKLQTLFLTSSPTGNLDGSFLVEGFDYRNDFAEQLTHYWKEDAACLMVSAFPDNVGANDEMKQYFSDAVKKTGLTCSRFDLWDARTPILSREEVQAYDVILLGGGHVPTQMKFFEKIGLREKLAGFAGLVIGISAGSMNCAELVYSQPEEPGEALDPNYVRFFPGLALTDLNISPHYQMVKDRILDGMHLFFDIIYKDSYGKEIYALPDGSYIKCSGGKKSIRGECWKIADGEIQWFGDREV